MGAPQETAVHLMARLSPAPGQEDALLQAIVGIVPTVTREPGCLFYNAHVSLETPGEIVMYEVWTNEAALQAHMAAPSFAGLSARLGAMLAEPLQVERLRRVA